MKTQIVGQLSLLDYFREKNPLPEWLQKKEEPAPVCTVNIGDEFIHAKYGTVIVSFIKYEPVYRDYLLICDAKKESSYCGSSFYVGKASEFGWNRTVREVCKNAIS